MINRNESKLIAQERKNFLARPVKRTPKPTASAVQKSLQSKKR